MNSLNNYFKRFLVPLFWGKLASILKISYESCFQLVRISWTEADWSRKRRYVWAGLRRYKSQRSIKRKCHAPTNSALLAVKKSDWLILNVIDKTPFKGFFKKILFY